MKNQMPPLAVNRQEAARLLGISIRNLQKIDSIPYFRIGKRILYSVEHLQKWITEQEKRNGADVTLHSVGENSNILSLKGEPLCYLRSKQ